MGLDTRLVPRRVGSVPPISNFLPGRRFALLLMPAGPTLWQHGALPFGLILRYGALTDVWMLWLFLQELFWTILIIHFVDDVGCPDAASSASSNFRSVSELCELLGMCRILDEGIRLAPAPERVQKVLAVIDQAVKQDSLEPVGESLAGKHNFLSTTTTCLGRRLLLA
eukprot:s2985_g4.t1